MDLSLWMDAIIRMNVCVVVVMAVIMIEQEIMSVVHADVDCLDHGHSKSLAMVLKTKRFRQRLH